MIDKIIEELVELIHGSQDAFGDGCNTAVTNSINIVKKYRNDGWIKGKPKAVLSMVTVKYDDGTYDIMEAICVDGISVINMENYDITNITIAWQPKSTPYKGE